MVPSLDVRQVVHAGAKINSSQPILLAHTEFTEVASHLDTRTMRLCSHHAVFKTKIVLAFHRPITQPSILNFTLALIILSKNPLPRVFMSTIFANTSFSSRHTLLHTFESIAQTLF